MTYLICPDDLASHPLRLQLCLPCSPFPSIKPLPRGLTLKPAERPQVRPPSQVTADRYRQDQLRSRMWGRGLALGKMKRKPWFFRRSCLLSSFLIQRLCWMCAATFPKSQGGTMVNTIALPSSFSLRLRYTTDGLRWWGGLTTCVRQNPLITPICKCLKHNTHVRSV